MFSFLGMELFKEREYSWVFPYKIQAALFHSASLDFRIAEKIGTCNIEEINSLRGLAEIHGGILKDIESAIAMDIFPVTQNEEETVAEVMRIFQSARY